MARKSKRMTLNEAIRQGQAKIANASKTRLDRSETTSSSTERSSEMLNFGDLTRKPVDSNSGLVTLKSKEKAPFLRESAQKTKLVVLFCVALVTVLALGVWLTSLILPDQSEQTQDQGIVSSDVVQSTQEQPRRVSAPDSDQLTSAEIGSVDQETSLAPSGGDNVIVIFTIEPERRDILRPVADFFRSKGIETDIITVSGKTALVTKAGFDQNPASQGTEGYKLLQRIKQLGPVYVEETQDTKFGVKPFQDVYGYKR